MVELCGTQVKYAALRKSLVESLNKIKQVLPNKTTVIDDGLLIADQII